MRWEFTELAALVAREDIRLMIACLRRRHSDPVKLMDAAYWVKGCSSLGRLRYALLVQVGHRRNAGLYLIDAKEAVKSAAPGVADKSMPKDNSLRVIAGAKALAPISATGWLRAALARLVWCCGNLRRMILKRSKPAAFKEAASLAAYLGDVVGLAHGRQMDKQTCTAWRNELAIIRKRLLLCALLALVYRRRSSHSPRGRLHSPIVASSVSRTGYWPS
jgi:uncharacterized protein (DUF2252 family)